MGGIVINNNGKVELKYEFYYDENFEKADTIAPGNNMSWDCGSWKWGKHDAYARIQVGEIIYHVTIYHVDSWHTERKLCYDGANWTIDDGKVDQEFDDDIVNKNGLDLYAKGEQKKALEKFEIAANVAKKKNDQKKLRDYQSNISKAKAEILYLDGLRLYQQNRYQDALEKFEQAKDTNKDNQESYIEKINEVTNKLAELNRSITHADNTSIEYETSNLPNTTKEKSYRVKNKEKHCNDILGIFETKSDNDLLNTILENHYNVVKNESANIDDRIESSKCIFSLIKESPENIFANDLAFEFVEYLKKICLENKIGRDKKTKI